jgi:hypothetical protein
MAAALAAASLARPAPAQGVTPTELFQGSFTWTRDYFQVGDTVHALQRSFEVRYARSPDGGRTWPTTDLLLNPQPSIARVESVAVDGDVLVLAGQSTPIAQQGGPLVVTSVDGGLTWSQPQQVNTWTSPSATLTTPAVGVHVDGLDVVLVWLETWSGELWTRRSTDGGQTWPSAPVRIDQGPAGIGAGQLTVFGSGDLVLAFRRMNAPPHRLQVSADGGQTWLATATAITSPASGGLSTPRTFVTGDASNLIASFDRQALVRSTDGGLTWSPTSPLTGYTIQALAGDGPRLLAAGTGVFGGQTVALTASTDGGATWTPIAPIAITGDVAVDVGIADDDLYAQFRSLPYAAQNLLAISEDDGLTWGVHLAGVHDLAVDDRRAVSVRFDYVSGATWSCKAFVAHGWTPLGSGTPGTSGATPRLAMVGAPLAGRSVDLTLADARANSLAAVGVSWQAPAAIPLAGGTLRVDAPLLPLAVALDANGDGAVPLSIPNTPAVADLRLVAQAVVLDPAAQSGLALTRALEIWLR